MKNCQWLNPQDGRWYNRTVWFMRNEGWVLEPTYHFGTDWVGFSEKNISIKF